VDTPYDPLLEKECPSWLYAVAHGGTIIWERWDSMLPDGTVNPGEMTFNHYALGAVADWMHRVVASIAALEPGYRWILFRPQPGGGLLTSASAGMRHLTRQLPSHGQSGDDGYTVAVEVPHRRYCTRATAGQEPREVRSGKFDYSVAPVSWGDVGST
jgi:alpha-L-rhamnosidase